MLSPMAKLWLKKGKISVIGSGRAQLLRAIEEHGSITKAAFAMNMSYRHAWGIIKHIRDSIGTEIVRTTRGGPEGGGARLTKVGRQLLNQFEENQREINNFLKYGPKPSLAVDGVIFEEDENLILIRRKNPPFQGELALPGGFVENNETTEAAVRREIKEELGIKTKIKHLIGVYSDPSRDPRQHIISVAYELEPLSTKFKAGDDAKSFERVSLKKLSSIDLESIAFDHGKIIKDAIELKFGRRK